MSIIYRHQQSLRNFYDGDLEKIKRRNKAQVGLWASSFAGAIFFISEIYWPMLICLGVGMYFHGKQPHIEYKMQQARENRKKLWSF